MGKAHLLHVGNQIGGDVPVAEKFSFAGAPPRTQMALINIHWAAVGGILGAVVHPVLISPLIASVQIINFGGYVGPGGGVEAVGIGFAHKGAVLPMYGVLIGVITIETGDKSLPNAAFYPLHGGGFQVPTIEITDDGYLGGVGSPDTEEIPLGSIGSLGGVGAETLPRMGGPALRKGFQLQKEVGRGELFLVFRHFHHLKIWFG